MEPLSYPPNLQENLHQCFESGIYIFWVLALEIGLDVGTEKEEQRGVARVRENDKGAGAWQGDDIFSCKLRSPTQTPTSEGVFVSRVGGWGEIRTSLTQLAPMMACISVQAVNYTAGSTLENPSMIYPVTEVTNPRGIPEFPTFLQPVTKIDLSSNSAFSSSLLLSSSPAQFLSISHREHCPFPRCLFLNVGFQKMSPTQSGCKTEQS